MTLRFQNPSSSRIDGRNPILKLGLYGNLFLMTNLDPWGENKFD